ncbi:fatty acid desaturase family protein [Aphanothece sacrum]|nr:fatty acid desaturase family protein [Aphanothece sacrum]
MADARFDEISIQSSLKVTRDETVDSERNFERSPKRAVAYLSPQQVFSSEGLTELNQPSNLKGILQLLGHLAVMVGSGYIWLNQDNLGLKIPALIIYGFTLATMFAALHECVHRTAFANNRLNDIVAWFAGLLSFYNSTFYRRYHKWHHRYTRIRDKDPELTDLTPTNLGEYLWVISGIPWWIGKVQTHYLCATGQMEDLPYIQETARGEIQRSVQLQLLTYLGAIIVSIYYQQPWFVLFWLLPLAMGQPLLRFILLAEHTACTFDANPFANTRTTLTAIPLRFLMWNMPFHAEHHFCPSIPFHALGKAHQKLQPHLCYVERGYINVNLGVVKNNTHKEIR